MKEDIIKMAQEAGIYVTRPDEFQNICIDDLKRFAALVRVDEHERLLAMMKQMHDAYALSSYPQGFKPKAKDEK